MMFRRLHSQIVLVLAAQTLAIISSDHSPILVADASITTNIRRMLNFGSILGSPTTTGNQDPYDRIMGHPVFQVTTSYGGAYMNMERMVGLDEIEDGSNSKKLDEQDRRTGALPLSGDSNEYRQIFLYYMDPEDALAAHAEFKQMDQMEKTDVRITSISLGKALNSAANLGSGGLLTGQPIQPLTGRVLPTREGGSLRHKIMPPKKQLYYAARCYGKERVGFFSSGGGGSADSAGSAVDEESARDAAKDSVVGNSALAYRNSMRRRAKRDRKIGRPQPRNVLEAQYAHMDGHVGIPVFYARGMERRLPFVKALISGNARETPLFFNYEDLQEAWRKAKVAGKKGQSSLPSEPQVEVFNLVDVLTSMEKDRARKAMKLKSSKLTERLSSQISAPFKRRLAPLFTSQRNAPLGLETVTFVPSSDACKYKEKITAQGNGKARLRPMR